ncbi:DNA cytosine methyltransferase [Prevotella sp. P6B1]|uniref:DNA cytosine methyltransferase n=1 Tax=Prevotella sp. P6B1 TaxID=1410613 RepID=UPI0009DF529E|nr:DNA cytosine methyltransferase [Prevotella sp. P6B1]
MNIVSLFAGCGGLDLGFEKAGFNVVWANEYDDSIHATYRYNHPNTILNTNDIRTLTGNDIPDCDGIIGGPPCQAWSEGGKQLGIEDPRGQLFFDYIRIVKDKKPKFFVIENVQGILDNKHKESLSGFMNLLREAGYRITYELLNAADYKIPQDRFRVFFVGIRNDLSNKFVFPNAVSSEPVTLRQAIGDITEVPRYYCDEKVEGDNPRRLNHDVYSGSYDAKYMARNRVRGWDETSFTMQAQARNAPQHPQAPKMVYVSPTQRVFAKGFEHLYRRLSVRECARIQSFPDKFRFIYDDVKDGYKMVGNAVPPRLAWYLAVQMKEAFSDIMGLVDTESRELNLQTINSIDIKNIAKENSGFIINNLKACLNVGGNISEVDVSENKTKRVLLCLVKPDNVAHYADQSAKIYYTGKRFPAVISLSKLYYFMPYMKGKGVRDLYLVKLVRVGTKSEVYPECNDNDFRFVFEIEFVKQLFSNYLPVHLNIWRTFTDTTLGELLKLNEKENIC